MGFDIVTDIAVNFIFDHMSLAHFKKIAQHVTFLSEIR